MARPPPSTLRELDLSGIGVAFVAARKSWRFDDAADADALGLSTSFTVFIVEPGVTR